MKKLLFYNIILALLVLNSCKKDPEDELIDFAVSFNSATVSLLEDDTTKEITFSFSRAATEAGSIVLGYTTENAVYGTDFTTSPAGDSGSITIPVAVGEVNKTLSLTKLLDPIEGTTKSVTFSITSFDDITWVKGSTNTALVSFTPIAALSGVFDVELGGSNEPNQVYIDLSTGQQTVVKRDAWELGFHNGTENRVFLNSSLLVSAAEIPGETDINTINSTTTFSEPLELTTLNFTTYQQDEIAVSTMDELLAGLPIGYTQYGNLDEGITFTDSASGKLEETAFAEISTTAEENYVYIIGLGNSIPTDPADSGSISTTGDHRGFMKVRILSDGNSYTIQYAELDATTFSEVTITKNSSKTLSSFSLTSGSEVNVEPNKELWDINFTGVFSYYGPYSGLIAGVTFSDFALHNTLGEVGLYQVTTYETVDGEVNTFDVSSYANFSGADVDESALVYDDKTVIGSGWRDSFGGVLKDDRYYVLKDASSNFYKIQFTAFLSSEGERGFPQFIYERL